jgi:hypothetical protein
MFRKESRTINNKNPTTRVMNKSKSKLLFEGNEELTDVDTTL